ncbi:SDR family NAD(P)-dependent oxidoreductase, partial [Pseudomonas sp. MWU13-2860]
EPFQPSHALSHRSDLALLALVHANITATILLLPHLLPPIPGAAKPQLFSTGPTSAPPRLGRPEVAFAASKFALSGMADALREEYRAQRLAVTCLQLGYLNTEDDLSVPREQAAERGAGQLIPLHDVVSLTRALLNLSDASFSREIILPAILDERF